MRQRVRTRNQEPLTGRLIAEKTSEGKKKNVVDDLMLAKIHEGRS
jgi:hypothetical protein